VPSAQSPRRKRAGCVSAARLCRCLPALCHHFFPFPLCQNVNPTTLITRTSTSEVPLLAGAESLITLLGGQAFPILYRYLYYRYSCAPSASCCFCWLLPPYYPLRALRASLPTISLLLLSLTLERNSSFSLAYSCRSSNLHFLLPSYPFLLLLLLPAPTSSALLPPILPFHSFFSCDVVQPHQLLDLGLSL
jgi:hypothetical protein